MILDDDLVSVAILMEETLKRKDVPPMVSPKIKRTKKHPSPPRDALEQLALSTGLMFGSVEAGAVNSTAASALLAKDANEAVKSAKQPTTGRVAFAMGQSAKSTGLVSNIAVKPLKSALHSPSTQGEIHHRLHNQNAVPDGSMDIDELQWNDTIYHIGSKKV